MDKLLDKRGGLFRKDADGDLDRRLARSAAIVQTGGTQIKR